MNARKILKLIAQFIVVYMFVLAAIFGAWLAGAEPSAWAFVLGAYASVLLVIFRGKKK